MRKFNNLIIACDGESASGKSTAAKLISKKYKLLLINSGLLYRYCSKLIIKHKPKNFVSFINNKFKNISYKKISKQNLHSQEISDHVAVLAKNKKIRQIINRYQIKIIKNCVNIKKYKFINLKKNILTILYFLLFIYYLFNVIIFFFFLCKLFILSF